VVSKAANPATGGGLAWRAWELHHPL